METTKLLVFADAHLSQGSKPEDQRWFPPRVAKMDTDQQRKYLRYWDDLTLMAYNKLLQEVRKQGHCQDIISLGDNTAGSHEQGMVSESAQSQFHAFTRMLQDNFPRVPRYFVWGGHDMGYWTRSTLIGSRTGGPSMKSFCAARTLLGSPWQCLKIGGYTLIILNSEIIKASRLTRDPLLGLYFSQHLQAQEAFLRQKLEQASGLVILAIHDFKAMRSLWPFIKPHKKKVVLTLTGHLHLKSLGALYRFFAPLTRALNARLVPSPWGIAIPWRAVGRGGFCTLKLSESGFDLKYHRL